jgi:hypothetical protein
MLGAVNDPSPGSTRTRTRDVSLGTFALAFTALTLALAAYFVGS